MTGDIAPEKNAETVEAKRKPPKMELNFGEDGVLNIEISGDFSRIEAGIGNQRILAELLSQMSIIGAPNKVIDTDSSNFALGFVDSMEPTDAAEALLLTQMATTHQAAMMLARRFNHVPNIPQQDYAVQALTKINRTYAAQMETLKRYRSKGQQTVRVERVTVENGGQAVVGDVHHGGRGNGKR